MDLQRNAAVTGLAVLWTVTAAAAGEVRGTVRLEGPAPEPVVLAMTSGSRTHPVEGCGGPSKMSPRLLVDAAGGIQNAVVWLEAPEPHGSPADTGHTVLDQRECVFEPHVLLLPVGGTVGIRNSDPVLHNLRVFREDAMVMNEWQKPQAAELPWHVEEPGRYLVRCGVHAWMHAWVIVADHPYYALTDAAGGFWLRGVPDGPHTLHVWHETLGEQALPVTVRDGSAVVTVRF